MITTINEFCKLNENLRLDDYMIQVYNSDYEELTSELFDFISEEGWLLSIEEEYNEEYTVADFEYISLNLTDADKHGLQTENVATVELFNAFDIELKKNQEYPFDTLDFIDYEKGIVHIIRLK